MTRAFKWIGYSVLGLVAAAGLAYAWAYRTATARYEQQWSVHTINFPIPYPLSAEEVEDFSRDRIAAGAPQADPLNGIDLQAVARERAVVRGRHLLQSRMNCTYCHGKDLGGSVILDQALVGRWAAPNLTTGEGSVVRTFTPADWDRAVRHAVRRTGQSSSMPSQEFLNVTDRELSDVISYIRSLPAVNRDVGAVKLGPVFAFMVARNPASGLPAFAIDHAKPHVVDPPAATASAEFGEHIVQVCRGCHGPNLSGGQIEGDPNMLIVANLTPHETGLKDWTETDFVRALREGTRKDGTAISEMMPWTAYGKMTDTEIKALWAYLRTVPAVEKGRR